MDKRIRALYPGKRTCSSGVKIQTFEGDQDASVSGGSHFVKHEGNWPSMKLMLWTVKREGEENLGF